MKFIKSFLILLVLSSTLQAQESLEYQKPVKEILDLVDVPLAPSIRIDQKGEHMIFLYRDGYKTITELSEKEMRLAGLRINPKTNISSRTNYYNNIKLKKIENEPVQVTGLPANPRISNISWSPDQTKAAFTNTNVDGVELWVLDIKSNKASKITDASLNANIGSPFRWFKDNASLLVKFLPKEKKSLINVDEAVPAGPTISISEGTKAQNRTYQDLLKNPNDEYNFEQLATSEIYKVNLDGSKKSWSKVGMILNYSFSPDGNYIMITEIKKPFSYLVPYYRFPQETAIYKSSGEIFKTINSVPMDEVRPKGFMATRIGKRSINWRSDKPSTLVWVEALDKGDPSIEVEYRDEVFQQDAPFESKPASILKTINRFSSIQWSNEKEIAFAYDYWWNTRNTKTYIFNPNKPSETPKIIHDRNYQDRYNDPGNFVRSRNEFGRSVINIIKGDAYLTGDGYSKEGQFPFIDQLNLKSNKTKRVYQSSYTDKVENIYFATNIDKGEFLVGIESPNEYPNFYIRNINSKDKLKQITNFKNPFSAIQDVHKEVIKYKREDGLELSGTLYLPIGYDKAKKEKMPMILWAYPEEFKDKKSASQSTSNPNEFTYPFWGSMIYWVTRGYVVLDDASFPIVGENDEEPNDSFRKQLVANAKAAIDAVDDLGYIDRNRVAVGGHSYGAFMTANLLSHSNLFAAGIARSGAYNRTLTPFGFQSEERSYWEAPDVYNTMSPFMHADKMKTPLLLIHGKADNNSGTYPLQSERYFNALKGLGATARLIMLPKESHGYRAKESILHLLWEQDQWLEKYVKNKKMPVSEGTN
ncbi:prolyl oligopeptidase family serine peptidase [Aquimarina sp. 2201CG14-23]|uniref:prolyl oligopeptidase family serine peptidase n=1 Tax=Aquimarina mycalae TaxID=3040073 RepID=UPI002478249B|nr:prolyl oligopeptidase family serine peptidase [Aquimarina sp. 2201CG14-23]MDH7445797.1 prolyl oligopeptidase family serine peptidase [Aquimarina sp. 2201CG14-23]